MQCSCAILSYVVCPAVQYYATLSLKGKKKKKKGLLNIKYGMIRNIFIYIGLHVKYPLMLSDFTDT
jgi:hypothetical protein